jgi:hypothetical protein
MSNNGLSLDISRRSAIISLHKMMRCVAMPCRIGITTDINGRRAYWRSQVVGFRNWRILRTFRRREDAQEYETWYAETFRCQAAPGGAPAPGLWYAYRFEYTRKAD